MVRDSIEEMRLVIARSLQLPPKAVGVKIDLKDPLLDRPNFTLPPPPNEDVAALIQRVLAVIVPAFRQMLSARMRRW